MEPWEVLLSSALVAAVVGPIASFFAQRALAERQSKIDYEARARIRLYEAVGPLRFQLLMASRDLVRRVSDHHRRRWIMSPSQYYGRSFVYRLLRPLAVAHLIEREMSFADFSVDPDAVALLRFQTAADRMLTGADAVEGHPGLDWSTQSQHVFRDNLRAAAATLISSSEPGVPAVLDYSAFSERFPDPSAVPTLEPLARLFDGCESNLTENAIFWARVVGYAYVCAWILRTQGADLGFSDRALGVEEMLRATSDPYIEAQAQDARQRFDAVISEGL